MEEQKSQPVESVPGTVTGNSNPQTQTIVVPTPQVETTGGVDTSINHDFNPELPKKPTARPSVKKTKAELAAEEAHTKEDGTVHKGAVDYPPVSEEVQKQSEQKGKEDADPDNKAGIPSTNLHGKVPEPIGNQGIDLSHVSASVPVSHEEGRTITDKEFEDEKEHVLKRVEEGNEQVTCSHRAAVLAINTPGTTFDQEEKVLSYKGGKSKLVIVP